MCRQCIILGALFNAGAYGDDIFPCETLARFDICVETRNAKGLSDQHASEYLRDTLHHFSQFGVDLLPIQVTSDGSCLPHSLSRAMAGYEVFYDALRASLVQELTDHCEWYKENLPERLNPDSRMDDEDWDKHWREIVEAARPTHGATVGMEKYLSGVHILAMANMLKRPILLLDTPERMASITPSNIDGCGLYLPCRHSREDIIRTHNRPLSPLMIAWQGPARNHFVALAQRRLPMEEQLAALLTKLPPQEMERWLMLMTEITSIPDDHIQKALCTVLENNAPSARDAACTTLITVLDNIHKYLQDPREVNKKYCTLSLQRPAVKHNLVGVSGALALLKAVGFREEMVDGVPSVVFSAGVEGVCRYHETLCRLMGCFTEKQSVRTTTAPLLNLRGAPFPGLCELSCVEDMQRLFGPKPLLLDSWEEAVQRFGSGGLDQGRVWALNWGRDATQLVLGMMERASKSFRTLSKGQFGSQGWSPMLRDAMDNVVDAALVVCPVCRGVSQYPVSRDLGVEQLEFTLNLAGMGSDDPGVFMCATCAKYGRYTLLSVRHTLYIRVLEMIRSSLSDSARTWKCDSATCGVANLDADDRCTTCRAPRPTKSLNEKRKGSAQMDGGDTLSAEAAPQKRINLQQLQDINTESKGSPAASEEKGTLHPAPSTGPSWMCETCCYPNEVERTECLYCLTPRGRVPYWATPSTRALFARSSAATVQVDIDAEVTQQQGEDVAVTVATVEGAEVDMPAPIGLHRSKTVDPRMTSYAVVYHTSLMSDRKAESGLPQQHGEKEAVTLLHTPPPLPIAISPRGFSQPVTQMELSFASDNISEATRDLGQMWRDTRSILMAETLDSDGEGGIALTIHLD